MTIWSHSSGSLLILTFLPFFCCSLIHFSSSHHGCVSGAAGTARAALSKDIVLLSVHGQHTLTLGKKNFQMHEKNILVCTFLHTHKPSSGVNEALEFLMAPPVRDRLCFIHPLISPFFARSSPPRVNFAFGHSSSLPPFTWLSLLRSELDLNPLLGARRRTQKQHTHAAGYSAP